MELHSPLHCRYSLTIKLVSAPSLSKLAYFLPLLLLAACTGASRDEGASLPPSLFSQPQSIAANPPGGYEINPVTGAPIQPVINSMGDTLVSGVPIPAQGKRLYLDSLPKPNVVKAPSLQSLYRHNAHPNRFIVPDNIPAIPVDDSQLKKVALGDGNQNFVLVNSIGDTIPTGVPIPA